MTPVPRARALTTLVLGLGLAATAAPADAQVPPPDSTAVQTPYGMRWCPAAVRDGARVRAFDDGVRRWQVGSALGWATPAPRLVTARGDTIDVTGRRLVAVSEGRTARRTLQGAVIGWLAGVVTVIADCGVESTCGEQNPIPLLGVAIGTVVGSKLRQERWVRTSDAACPTRAAPDPNGERQQG
ncbi:hypothetical protein [Roseisolibacter agri]|uniref:Uncharacterized protein n=1 Tax=Roseisolibacter agri TaxID=2014610 RepID=A0AA37V161_9BACT|nr:hypothetical protein [Roseisolibacter agri]GLC25675.1 hypothetical protein rosag_21880 [Roseisolibacter agri]